MTCWVRVVMVRVFSTFSTVTSRLATGLAKALAARERRVTKTAFIVNVGDGLLKKGVFQKVDCVKGVY